MKFGKLDFVDTETAPELLAEPTLEATRKNNLQTKVFVSEIDSSLADTAAFCETYDIGLDVSANCVVLEAKRADKISFAPMDTATMLTQMEYGGITPLGLPDDWQILVDSEVVKHDKVIIGSGIRGSKLLVESSIFASLPNTSIKDIVKAS